MKEAIYPSTGWKLWMAWPLSRSGLKFGLISLLKRVKISPWVLRVWWSPTLKWSIRVFHTMLWITIQLMLCQWWYLRKRNQRKFLPLQLIKMLSKWINQCSSHLIATSNLNNLSNLSSNSRVGMLTLFHLNNNSSSKTNSNSSLLLNNNNSSSSSNLCGNLSNHGTYLSNHLLLSNNSSKTSSNSNLCGNHNRFNQTLNLSNNNSNSSLPRTITSSNNSSNL